HGDLWDGAERRTLRIGDGSSLLMKQNGLSKDGKEFSNGELLQVREVWPDVLRVENAKGVEMTLDRLRLVANLGYAVTSYSSQGKTVDRVLVVDSGSTAAQNRKEWYVSLSRGRRAAEVFTEAPASLANRIKADGERELAYELKGADEAKHASASTWRRVLRHSMKVARLAHAAARRVQHSSSQRMK